MQSTQVREAQESMRQDNALRGNQGVLSLGYGDTHASMSTGSYPSLPRKPSYLSQCLPQDRCDLERIQFVCSAEVPFGAERER